MSKRSTETSELVTHATALEEELREFERLMHSLENASLKSQRDLARSADLLRELVATEDRLGGALGQLAQAIGRARERQETQAAAVRARAQAIEARSTTLQALLTKYAALGQEASSLNVLLAESAETGEFGSTVPGVLPGVQERITQVIDNASELIETAKRDDFADVAREADSLRQALITLKGSVNIIEKRTGKVTLN